MVLLSKRPAAANVRSPEIYINIWNFQRESSNEWPSALRHRRIVVSNYLCAMQYVDACQRGSECAVVVMQ